MRKNAIAWGVLALGLVTGCGGSGGGGTGGGASAAPMVRRVAFPAGVKGFDPAQASDLYSGTAALQIYEPLYEFHYLDRPYHLVPLTAEALPELSADGKTYTIRLRKGIRFHDDPCFPGGKGRELTIADYVYQWKRVADPKVQSPLWAFFQERIVGLDAVREKASTAGKMDYDAPVAGLQTPDPYTLVITLTSPHAPFGSLLAMPFTAAAPREAVEKYGDEFINHGVGTGAYRLKEWVPNSLIVLERNPDYRDVRYPDSGEPSDRAEGRLADAGKRVPFCDRIEMTIIVEDQPRWLQFEAGKLDNLGIPKDAFGKAVVGERVAPYLSEKGVVLQRVGELDVTYMAFNMTDPVVGGTKGRLLRRAIACGHDLGPYREIFFNGRGIFAQSAIPPGLFGYDSAYRNPHQQFDLAKAKQLIAEAGYPEGKGLPEIVYDTLNDTTSRQMGEHLKDQMARIGVRLRMEINTWPAFDEKLNKRQSQMWGVAWGADYPDAENFLQLFYGPNSAPNGQNSSCYDNPEVNRLYEELRVMPDTPTRLAKIQRIRDLTAEDSPWVYELHRETWILVHPWLKNYKYPSFLGGGYLKYTRVDMDERRARIGE